MTATVTPITKSSKVTCPSPEASRTAVTAMSVATGSAATDGTRHILTHVLVQGTGETLKFISTNTYRANRVELTMLDKFETMPFMVNAKELKAALPKLSEFKVNGNDRLTIEYHPGKAILDPAQFHLTWGNNQRILSATPCEVGGERFTQYPNVEDLIDSAFTEKLIASEPVCYNPALLSDICKEAKQVNKDRPLQITPGPTPLKPALFTTFNDGISYTSLLMPVRMP